MSQEWKCAVCGEDSGPYGHIKCHEYDELKRRAVRMRAGIEAEIKKYDLTDPDTAAELADLVEALK